MRAIFRQSFLVTVFALPLMSFAGSTPEEEKQAIEYLGKMTDALRDESYTGTFVYMRGSRFDTMRVTHHLKDGHEIERLVNLTGAEREIIRTDDHAVCLHADAKSSLVHAMPRGPFTHSFHDNLVENLGLYQYGVHGVGRIAGRPAVRISITPKNRDRYGYRLWLDEETGLLLRSNLVNNGRVLEVFQFTDIEIGVEPTEEDLTTSVAMDTPYQHVIEDPQQLAELPAGQTAAQPAWRVNWMPSGFRQVRSRTGEGMVFTDGVATLSIFVEKRGKNALGDVQTTVGGTAVLSRPIKGSSEQITVVGEVPIDTAKKVAESIEPVIY